MGILSDLPMHIRLVCARLINTADKTKDMVEELVEAKYDGSISDSGTITETSQSKLKSRPKWNSISIVVYLLQKLCSCC